MNADKSKCFVFICADLRYLRLNFSYPRFCGDSEGESMPNTTDLASMSSKPIAPGTPAATDKQITDWLKQLPGWERKGGEIAKTFAFKNYYETMAFVNATAWISHREDHHPDMEVGYNKCTM